jgi:mannose-6-phosphate isomerase-like protein (cupin superfamily)
MNTFFELKDVTKRNEYFRQVLFTGKHSQLVVMSLEPGEEIGEEIHDVDQFLYAVKGSGRVGLDGTWSEFEKGEAICVPAGTAHNVVAAMDEPLKLFTIYAPPQHAAGTIQETKPAHEMAPA